MSRREERVREVLCLLALVALAVFAEDIAREATRGSPIAHYIHPTT